jgi:hypothetical protein
MEPFGLADAAPVSFAPPRDAHDITENIINIINIRISTNKAIAKRPRLSNRLRYGIF